MPKTPKKKKFPYSPLKIQKAVDAVREGMPVLKASKEFKVPRTTLRNKLEGKSPLESTGHCGFSSHLGKDNEKVLVNWVLDCAKIGFPINKDSLLSSVQKLVNALKRNILFTPRNAALSFQNLLPWPESIKSEKNMKRKKEYTPSVVTCDEWADYFEQKEKEKQIIEERKKEREQERLEKRQIKQKALSNTFKKKKEKITKKNLSSSSEDEMSLPSDIDGSSSDIEGALDKSMKPGDFILVKFIAYGKRSTVYTYVATVRQAVVDELEVQCLKSINKEKTIFEDIENDISTVPRSDVLGLLPDHSLVEKGRKFVVKFSESVNVHEK